MPWQALITSSRFAQTQWTAMLYVESPQVEGFPART